MNKNKMKLDKAFINLGLLLITLFTINSVKAQSSIQGIAIDADSQKPLSCVQVKIQGGDNELDTILFTKDNGVFVLNNIENGFYYICLTRIDYRNNDKEVELNDSSFNMNFQMYSIYSDSFHFEDIASEDIFDFTLGFDIYSPALQESDDKFKSVFAFDYGYEGRFKLANRMQLGIRYSPLKVKWMAMNSDTMITNVPHGKERYFEASTSLGLYLRYIITTRGYKGNRGLFVDLGASYSLPYYFSYTYFTDEHIKTSQNKIRKFNDFQAMFRLGFYWGSLRANYRFTDIMKDEFIQPPRLTLGIEFNIPTI